MYLGSVEGGAGGVTPGESDEEHGERWGLHVFKTCEVINPNSVNLMKQTSGM